MVKSSRKQIFKIVLRLRKEGRLYDLNNRIQADTFRGSIDRFCWIAQEFHGREKILDVGTGTGLMVSLLSELGHECYGVDIQEQFIKEFPMEYSKLKSFEICNVEADPLPFQDNFFDAVSCCQVLEHFSYSHLPAILEMRRVLKPGGIIEVDVPNIVCFRNRVRMIRGKTIFYEYERFLKEEPIEYKGRPYFPLRHNREFTLKELAMLLKEAKFRDVRCYYLKSRRYRTGLERIRTIGTMIKDLVPPFRKSLIGFAYK